MKYSSHEQRFLYLRTPERLPEQGREHMSERIPVSPVAQAQEQFHALVDNVHDMASQLPEDIVSEVNSETEDAITQTTTATQDLLGRTLHEVATIEQDNTMAA